jgi:CheY-like chemotaxis protein
MTKVLLADDDATMISLLTTLLGMEGYQVGTVLDKQGSILDIIRSEKPDAMLIDVYLGNLNGLDLVRDIRGSDEMKGIKIIMASGVDKSEECLAAGADAFLLKPYMPDDLFKYLRA